MKIAAAIAELADPAFGVVVGNKLSLGGQTGVVEKGGAIKTDT